MYLDYPQTRASQPGCVRNWLFLRALRPQTLLQLVLIQ